MSDLIDRQQAIDWCLEGLNNMPSAQPDSKELSSTHKALDTISRAAAIDEFYCTDELIVSGSANAQNVTNYINKVIGKINALPPAQPVLTCDGCRHVGTYDTDFPCNGCVRREKDYYDPER